MVKFQMLRKLVVAQFEILAGLAAVLPKNVFLYVASIPNLAALGTRFVLQGGTQNNLAVVKAEVDFINNSFRAAGKKAGHSDCLPPTRRRIVILSRPH